MSAYNSKKNCQNQVSLITIIATFFNVNGFSTRALIGDRHYSNKLTQIKSNVGFCGEKKTGVPGEKSLREQKGEPTNSTHI